MSIMNNIHEWHPIEHISKELPYIEYILDDYEGLKILLAYEKESKYMLITFDNFYGYRNFNESERLKTWAEMPELTTKWSLYRRKNSKFTKWLSSESLGIVEETNINHYIITTGDDVVEILAPEPPIVKWMKDKNIQT